MAQDSWKACFSAADQGAERGQRAFLEEKRFPSPTTQSVSAIAGTSILTLSIHVLCPVAVPKLKTLRWVLRFGEAKSS